MNEIPKRYALDPKNEKTILAEAVRTALQSLPHYFESPISIQGLSATDLFSINTLLGGAIEEQTVRILNNMRNVWDPEDKWVDRRFVRFPESFPDVRLVKGLQDDKPLIGIELKGWYLLSKEAEPSFRFKASANAVTEWDLIACFPWALSEVLSGVPVVYEPYVEQAKYAADMRTYYWTHRKGDTASRSNRISFPKTTPYPRAGTKFVDVPEIDSNNFGRIARVSGLMQEWCAQSLEIKLSGIEASYWIKFLSAFKEGMSSEDKEKEIEKIVHTIREQRGLTPTKENQLFAYLEGLLALLNS